MDHHPTFCDGHFVRMLLCYKMGQVRTRFCKQTNVAACRFQNESNKVEIALRVVQFWSEIKLNCDYKSHSRFAVVRFCNHAFDFRPNCTPLSAITIIYRDSNFSFFVMESILPVFYPPRMPCRVNKKIKFILNSRFT